ncbi:integral peroxisomal membrane peroxin-domain-containing protein [Schizophyllum commune]
MPVLDFIDLPPCATPLPPSGSQPEKRPARPAHTIRASLPSIDTDVLARERKLSSPASPAKASPSYASTIIPQVLFATLPTSEAGAPQKRDPKSQKLLSKRDPLSIQITTINFKRFIEVVGPVFWLQDRIEEILFWRKGAKVTGVWMAAYAFICLYPRLLLVLPNIVLIALILLPSTSAAPNANVKPRPTQPLDTPPTGVDYQANVQAIQNLMGFVADMHDAVVVPYVIPFFAPANATKRHIALTLLTTTLLPTLFLVSLPYFPIRWLCLIGGLSIWSLFNPHVRYFLFAPSQVLEPEWSHAFVDLFHSCRAVFRKVRGRAESQARWPWLHAHDAGKWARMRAARAVDDDNLTDDAWRSEMEEVELYENERLAPGADGKQPAWSKEALKPTVDRAAWTRGRDGWSGIDEQGGGSVSSNLTFSLAPGWKFVETETWRADLVGEWSGVGADDDGWVYTTDAWQDPAPYPEPGKVTRRRRWIRRVYYAVGVGRKDASAGCTPEKPEE